MNDPIIEEVRRIRDEHSKRFDYDLDAICDDYKTHQVQAGGGWYDSTQKWQLALRSTGSLFRCRSAATGEIGR
ncbi:hypothetical protein [Candidatus Thiosymbion oneisti]|uniref:hypothetical protein n=1 Tax=Candidatus Thiosymbion oneisti TaxID=589554 RepID=UPI00114CA808|nr:hypothetical protein [Candidatus Thiosymbion oneisti]